MPRRGRVVFPGVPHHVTQRGNHRERVFFSPGDPESYLYLLREHAKQLGIDIAAYCLMPNHVHLVVVPSTAHAMHYALKAVNGQYAQRINRMRDQKGHLWQGRYFSSPLDESHFSNAVRYVELNPVDAGMVVAAEDYAWSSAAAHCGIREDPILRPRQEFNVLAGIVDWSRWLAKGVAEEVRQTLRRHTSQNVPCGSPEFVARLELAAGRQLRYRPHGGDRMGAGSPKQKGDASLGREASLFSGQGERPLESKVNVPLVTSARSRASRA